MIDNPQTLASLSPAFADALQNSRHALLTEDPAESLARVLTTFHNEHRAEVLRDAEEICDEAGASYTDRALNEHADAAYTLMERFRRKAEEAEQTGDAMPVQPATHATVPDRAVRAEAFRDAANGAYLNVHSAAAEGVRRWLLALADFELRRMADEAQQQPE